MRVLEMEDRMTKPRKISVSGKRQITIPLEFYKALKIEDEVECVMKENSIIIRPVINTSQDNFADLILEDLINEGFKGKELLKEFKKRKEEIKESINHVKTEADKVAENEAPYSTIDEVFKEEE